MALEVTESPMTRFAQEAERRRIARELHDGVVQSLTALLTDLEYYRTRRLSANSETNQEMARRLETWQELARDSLLSMRETLGGLRHHSELDYGMESSVSTLLEPLRQSGYIVLFECEDWPVCLPHTYASNLYAIIRELLTNICKHAHASKISIFMFSHEGQLHVSVADNGVGLPGPATRYTKGGYHQGLLGLQERASMLGGRCTIESAPDRGTRVDVAVPLP